MSVGEMETLRQALARLEDRGFAEAFKARADGMLEHADGGALAPESLIVDEVVRFEGRSDPEDQAVVFALRTEDGAVKGTFTATFGPAVGPECAAVMERLPSEPTDSRSPGRSA